LFGFLIGLALARGHGHGGGDGHGHEDGHHHNKEPCVEDRQRACPDGFFYAGEVTVSDQVTRGEYWTDGGASPVYSCYQVYSGNFDWVTATDKCNDIEGQLLSVNDFQEDKILTGDLFLSRLNLNEVTTFGPVLTSGVSLLPGNWTWFGRGEPMNDNLTEAMNEIQDEMNEMNNTSDGTQCVLLNWIHNSTYSTELVYEIKPCIGEYETAICEVRAYTQTWYVWFSINWLQILFLFTLVLLIVSSCVTMQVWTSRPRRAAARGRVTRSSPPPYTANPEDFPMPAQNTTSDLGNKYKEKGKELLAKVVFYRKAEDKQKLTPDA